MKAEEFLRLFKHKKFTLGHYNGKSMRTFPVAPSRLPDALKILNEKNKNQEIYFMVNEGNGVYNDKKTGCHRSENVINLSALFLDAELRSNDDPLTAVLEFAEENDFPFSVSVKTSDKRYHIYWLLDEAPATKENIKMWQQLQSFLHSRLSVDRTMTDIPQVLRIPGFRNNIKKFDVAVTSYEPVTYDLAFVYKQFLNSHPEIKDIAPFEPLKPLTDDHKIPPGERHEELLRRARKLYSMNLTDSEVKCCIDGIIQNHVDENLDFRPGGKRYAEVERILSAAKTYHEEARQKELANQIAKHTEVKKQSEFELDPDFYYNAPGIVGELTRHMVNASNYPIPAHAYAAAVSLVGFTKCRYIQGARQLPPLNYFICLAPAGGGKTTIQDILKEAVKKINIGHLFEDGIASAQGLIKFLSQTHSIGFIMYDEVKDLFQTISNKYAANYETKIATELTKLYTAYRSFYTPPTKKTDKGKKIILEKPLFSFLGYGHHTLIDQLFTKNNVLEGLLPRFIILNVNNRTSHHAVYKPIPSHILDELNYNITESMLAIEEKAEQSEVPVNTTPNTRILPLTQESQTLYNEFESKIITLYNNAVSEKSGLEALYSRAMEQTLRLSLAMANDAITATELQFAITLIDSQTQAFYKKFEKTVNRTEFAKENDDLLATIIELCNESPDYAISKRDLQRRTQSRYKTADLFHKHLNALIEKEYITEFQKTLPSGKKQNRIKVDDILE